MQTLHTPFLSSVLPTLDGGRLNLCSTSESCFTRRSFSALKWEEYCSLNSWISLASSSESSRTDPKKRINLNNHHHYEKLSLKSFCHTSKVCGVIITVSRFTVIRQPMFIHCDAALYAYYRLISWFGFPCLASITTP